MARREDDLKVGSLSILRTQPCRLLHSDPSRCSDESLQHIEDSIMSMRYLSATVTDAGEVVPSIIAQCDAGLAGRAGVGEGDTVRRKAEIQTSCDTVVRV